MSWGYECVLLAGFTVVYGDSTTSLALQHRDSGLSTHCTCKEASLKVNVLKITTLEKSWEKRKTNVRRIRKTEHETVGMV